MAKTHTAKNGPNGIPYAAYAAAGLYGCCVLARASRRAQSGKKFKYGFNDSEVMFPPKGKRPDDVSLVARHSSETRPLKCKDHDNKIISGEINHSLSWVVKKYANTLQNGFIKGRNFLCNVVAIDAYARYASIIGPSTFMPLIILFDLLSAFP